MSVYKAIHERDASFLLLTERVCNVRCLRCSNDFRFDLEWSNPLIERYSHTLHCPHCASSIDIPYDVFYSWLPQKSFHTDTNGVHTATCWCRHSFTFKLEDINPRWSGDSLCCPNCKEILATEPPYINPIQYTKLSNFTDFMRYLRVTTEVDDTMLLNYLHSLNEEDLTSSFSSVLDYVDMPNYKHAFLLMLDIFGVDIILNNLNLYSKYMRKHELYLNGDDTHYEYIQAMHWKKYGKSIMNNKMNSYFSCYKFGDSVDSVLISINMIKATVDIYGIDVISPVIFTGGRLDDGALIDESESTVYGMLCRAIIKSPTQELAQLYIDLLLWLREKGLKSPCYIHSAQRAGGDTEYIFNRTIDYSKEMEIILSNPDGAYQLLHKN